MQTELHTKRCKKFLVMFNVTVQVEGCLSVEWRVTIPTLKDLNTQSPTVACVYRLH